MQAIYVNIKTVLLILGFLTFLVQNTTAQNGEYGWRVGFGTGFMDYYGDITSESYKKSLKNHYKNAIDFDANRGLSYMVTVECRLSPGLTLAFAGTKGIFAASDRANTQSLYYARALNFETKLTDLDATFLWRSDGSLLGERFPIAPYIYLGGGATQFKVHGDLKDASGNFYNYADVVAPVLDGNYETDLTNIGTNPGGKYATIVPHVTGGVGLRLRFLNILSLHVQTDLKYAFSDFLDDAGSTAYPAKYISPEQAFATSPNSTYTGPRAKTDNWGDMYAFTSASLRLSFGRKKEGFTPPIFYASALDTKPAEELKLIPNEVKVGNQTIVIYDTIKVIRDGYTERIDETNKGSAKAMIDSLEKVKLSNAEMQNQMATARAEYEQMQRQLMLQQSSNQATMLRQMDSLQTALNKLTITVNSADTETAIKDKTLTELQAMRQEMERLRQKEANRQSTEQIKVEKNEIDRKKMQANARNQQEMHEANYQRYHSEIGQLRADIANLTAAVNGLVIRQNMPAPNPQQVIIQQPVAPATTSTADPALWTSLNRLQAELGQINARLAALESRSVENNKPPQNITVNTPAPANNTALEAEYLRKMNEMREQLNTMNKQMEEMGKKNNEPVVIEKPVIVEKTVTIPAPAPSITYIEAATRMGSVSIFFDTNSSVIKPSEIVKLEQIVNVLRQYPEASLTVNGFADAQGNSEYNLKLSEKRAVAVRDRFIQGYGIAQNRIIYNGLGAAISGGAANATDRRVDLNWVK